MVKVAIAGGTGDVGRTIVEVIRNDSKHEAIVLARKVSEPRKEKPETYCLRFTYSPRKSNSVPLLSSLTIRMYRP